MGSVFGFGKTDNAWNISGQLRAAYRRYYQAAAFVAGFYMVFHNACRACRDSRMHRFVNRAILYAGEELKEWAGFLLDILIASAAVTTALIILVRGHIRVIDKRLPKYADLGAEALRAGS